MHTDGQLSLVDQVRDNEAVFAGVAKPFGHALSVSGSQVVVQFSAEIPSTGQDDFDATVGTFLVLRTRSAFVVGVLVEVCLDSLTSGLQGSHATGRVDLLGEIISDRSGARRFELGVMNYPTIGSPIVPITDDELRLIFDVAGPDTIDVGRLQQASSIGAYINVDQMVRKHFAILGSTGAGKSSAVAVILREIMQARPDLRIVLIDSHNEYGRCFEDRAHIVGPGNLRLPFWLFNFEELIEVVFGERGHAEEEVGLLAELIPQAKKDYLHGRVDDRTSYRQVDRPEGSGYTVDTPAPYCLDHLIALIENRMGKLENHAIALLYQRLLMRINAVRKNPRYSFIFDDINGGSDTMVELLCQLLRLQPDGRPMTIMQLAGFPAEVFDVVVSVLFRMAFEFGLWSDGARPLLVVCEEAHHYANADLAVGFGPAREAVSRIAKEGRKYGVFLGLITQRPSELDSTLISQCSTVFAMRMANDSDQRIVRAAVSDAASRLLGFLPSLRTREALAFGEGVPVPARLRFKELPDRFIPKSEAIWSGRVDAGIKVDKAFVTLVVDRWRGVAMSKKPQLGAGKLDSFLIPNDSPSDWLTPALRK